MNYYDILKVKKDTSEKEIRKSYKTLIKQYHPDIYKGNKDFAEKICKDLNDAYDILSNSEKRAEYDLLLETPIINKQTSDNIYHYSYNQYSSNYNSEKNNFENWHKKFKNNLYNYVDKKTLNMSSKAKITIVLAIILLSLLLTLLSINDYLTLITTLKK